MIIDKKTFLWKYNTHEGIEKERTQYQLICGQKSQKAIKYMENTKAYPTLTFSFVPFQSHSTREPSPEAQNCSSGCSQLSSEFSPCSQLPLDLLYLGRISLKILKKVIYQDQGGTLKTVMMLKLFVLYLNKHSSRDYAIKPIWIRSVRNISISDAEQK